MVLPLANVRNLDLPITASWLELEFIFSSESFTVFRNPVEF